MELPHQPENKALGYSKTPILPSGYHVHDGTRPQPPVVQAPADAPPSDAMVLFDGKDLGKWCSQKDPAKAAPWKIVDGAMEVVPGKGDIQTVDSFGDCQLHLEFASPAAVKGEGQGRGNSGVFLMGCYEVQVLDNYDNPTYPDGTVGAVYGQTPPLVNALRAPGEWNTYDILWTAPVFAPGKLVSRARVTVLLNGVVVQRNTELEGPTQHKELAHYLPHAAKAPLRLQDHGDLVRFRNIWLREL